MRSCQASGTRDSTAPAAGRPGSPGLPAARGIVRAAQDRGGNTPCMAIQKLRVRYGIMLLWGRLPPATLSALGASCVCAPLLSGAYLEAPPTPTANFSLDGERSPPSPPDVTTPCVWSGVSVWRRVTDSVPDAWPRK